MLEPAREYLREMGKLDATDSTAELRRIQARTRGLISQISDEDAREIERAERSSHAAVKERSGEV